MIRSPARSEIAINVTPMIDVMIFLIVFFLAATNFAEVEREQDVQLPGTQGVGNLSRTLDTKLTINVKQDGSTVVSGKTYDAKDLEALVREHRLRLKEALKVEIRADRRAYHGDVARVLALVRSAGVLRPIIDTRQVSLDR